MKIIFLLFLIVYFGCEKKKPQLEQDIFNTAEDEDLPSEVESQEEEAEQESQEIDVDSREPTYYSVNNFDECINADDSCLIPVKTINHSSKVKLVKLLPNSSIYDEINLENLRTVDRKTLKGAAFVSVQKSIQYALEKAAEANFSIPENLHVDPLCTMPQSQNNAYFLPEYGYDDKKISNNICFGSQFHDGISYPLANDKFVSTHELFHVLFHHEIVGTDKIVPENAIFLSHELDSFNEGAADFFSSAVTESQLNRFFRNILPWRLFGQRRTLGFKHGPYGHIYRDGMKWTELFEELNFRQDALPILQCTVNHLGTILRLAKDEADRRDHEAGFKLGRHLLRFNFWDFSWSIFEKDILNSVENCTPDSLKNDLRQIVSDLFPQVPPDKMLATNADARLILFPSLESLCQFQRDYELGPGDLRRYEYADACNKAFSFSWSQAEFNMSEEEQARDTFTSNKNESLFVLPMIRLNGFGANCHLRGASAPDHAEIRLFDARQHQIGPAGKKFSHQIFMNTRGSWYRDVPLGSFLPTTQVADYELKGLLGPFSREGFRGIPRPSKHGLPTTGFSGYFWQTTYDFREDESINSLLSLWAEHTLRPYLVSKKPLLVPEWCSTCSRLPVGEKCSFPSPNCERTANYFVECTSHKAGKTIENPLGEGDKKIWIREAKAFVYDCSEKGRACDLRSY